LLGHNKWEITIILMKKLVIDNLFQSIFVNFFFMNRFYDIILMIHEKFLWINYNEMAWLKINISSYWVPKNYWNSQELNQPDILVSGAFFSNYITKCDLKRAFMWKNGLKKALILYLTGNKCNNDLRFIWLRFYQAYKYLKKCHLKLKYRSTVS